MERHIPFVAVHNFRDLGGYEAAGGRPIRWRRLFRADSLQGLSQDEARWLRDELGLRTVIDMQGGVGRDPGPLVANGVNRHHLSIWDDHMQELLMRLERPISGEFYVTLAERFGLQFTEALRLLSEEGSYPAVFHCTIGKDRTGVLAALLLATLGVDDETIIADYGLSNSAIAQIREHLLTLPDLSDDYKARLDLTLAVEPLAIATLLDELRARHGSIEEFVNKHGLKEQELRRIQEILLT